MEKIAFNDSMTGGHVAGEGTAEHLVYNPNGLLDALIERMNLKNDAALSRALEVAPPLISKLRHGRLPVGAFILIRMHEVTKLSIRELRDLMGDRREKFGYGWKKAGGQG